MCGEIVYILRKMICKSWRADGYVALQEKSKKARF